MTKVLVLGGRGMIGAGVVAALEAQGIEVVKTTRNPTDGKTLQFEVGKTPLAAVLTNLEPGDYVFNAIGLIKQRIDENLAADRLRAIQLNADLPYRLAAAAAALGLRVIQVATDCVFEGNAGSYLEDSVQDATDVYGKTKSLGEVPAANVMHIRCSVIGPELEGGLSLLEWVRKQPANANLNGYTNHIWNGVTASAFGQVIAGLVSSDTFSAGVQHLVPADVVNKHQLVQLIAARLGRNDLTFTPVAPEHGVNRTLATSNVEANQMLWSNAGYANVPSISGLVQAMEL
jgi:dTDP-4-dehydrorhamnose reductase